MMNPRTIILIATMIFLTTNSLAAPKNTNSAEAQRIFNKAYQQVFGPQGSTLRYDVNIGGIYKTHGRIWMKGTKAKFQEERVDGWSDGVTAHMVYKKKKVIEIHDAASDKKDKYSGKFKFTLDDFTYSMERQTDGILLTLKQKKSAKGTIKEVKALIDAKTYAPVQMKLKVLFFWATVSITDFSSGGISDQLFVFPRSRYGADYKIVDKRGEH